MLSIAPDCAVVAQNAFYGAGNPLAAKLTAEPPDLWWTPSTTSPPRSTLICRCQGAGIPIISAMGAGNKLDPMGFAVMDLFQTSYDPGARTAAGAEEARRVAPDRGRVVRFRKQSRRRAGRHAPASIAFVPPGHGSAHRRACAQNPGRDRERRLPWSLEAGTVIQVAGTALVAL